MQTTRPVPVVRTPSDTKICVACECSCEFVPVDHDVTLHFEVIETYFHSAYSQAL